MKDCQTMELSLIPVDDTNIEVMKRLSIRADQQGMVESVEECYEEAKRFSLWHPVGIADRGTLIGFAMFGLWIDEGEDGRVWLDRFFIDEQSQGKGYAKPVLNYLIEEIKRMYGYPCLYLSVYANNQRAIDIYRSLGFVFNGELDIHGERVMILEF